MTEADQFVQCVGCGGVGATMLTAYSVVDLTTGIRTPLRAQEPEPGPCMMCGGTGVTRPMCPHGRAGGVPCPWCLGLNGA